LGWSVAPPEPLPAAADQFQVETAISPHPDQIDPFYLFACHVEWEQREEPSDA